MSVVIFCFYLSLKKGVLQKRDIKIHSMIWFGCSIIAWMFLYFADRSFLPDIGVMFSLGIALCLVPFALAPMALHWNRHR